MAKIPVTRATAAQQGPDSLCRVLVAKLPRVSIMSKVCVGLGRKVREAFSTGKGPVLTRERRQVEEACILGKKFKG